ncbi:hypothetical protein LguiA_033170 [Lonicera macranthoides]
MRKSGPLFSSITRNVEIGNEDFYFARLLEKLNAHSRIKNHRWIERMKRDYFTSPWSLVSVNIVLLLLTIIQTFEK